MLGSCQTVQQAKPRYAGKCLIPTELAAYKDEDLKLTSLQAGKVALGELDITSHPHVMDLISEAARSQLVMNFILCDNAQQGILEISDKDMTTYFMMRLQFLGTHPSPQQIQEWESANPAPRASKGR
jgi:hypothetical protein